MTPRVVLVGAPGAGKTTVGPARRRVARRGAPRHRRRGRRQLRACPVSHIFVTRGSRTSATWSAPLSPTRSRPTRGVVAVGGGAVLDAGTRELLRAVPTVWLRGRAGRGTRPGRHEPGPAAAARQRTRPAARAAGRAGAAVRRGGDGDRRHRRPGPRSGRHRRARRPRRGAMTAAPPTRPPRTCSKRRESAPDPTFRAGTRSGGGRAWLR